MKESPDFSMVINGQFALCNKQVIPACVKVIFSCNLLPNEFSTQRYLFPQQIIIKRAKNINVLNGEFFFSIS